MLLDLECPKPAGRVNSNAACGDIFLTNAVYEKSDLQFQTTFAGAENQGMHVTTGFFQKLFGNRTVYVALDERCFADTVVSNDNDFHFSLGLTQEVRCTIVASFQTSKQQIERKKINE